MIDAIILAAGAGRRLRTLGVKPLLQIEGKTFLQKSVENISKTDIERIVVVVSEQLSGLLPDEITEKAEVVVNEDPLRGMLSSILTGAEHLNSRNSVLIFPVDFALVQQKTIDKLVLYAQKNNDVVVVPTYSGRRGHPVVFPFWSLNMLAKHNPSDGARWIPHRFPDKVIEMRTDDVGTVIDIDTPEDYYKYIARQD